MEAMTRQRWERMSKAERVEHERQMAEYAKRRRGGMAYESSIVDPKTGRSFTHPDNSPKARRQRLRVVEAYRRLDAAPEFVLQAHQFSNLPHGQPLL